MADDLGISDGSEARTIWSISCTKNFPCFGDKSKFEHLGYARIDSFIELFPISGIRSDCFYIIPKGSFNPEFSLGFSGPLLHFYGSHDVWVAVRMKFCGIYWIDVPKHLPEGDVSPFLPVGFQFRDTYRITLKWGYIEIIEERIDIESGSAAYNRKFSAASNIRDCLFGIITEQGRIKCLVRMDKVEAPMSDILHFFRSDFPRSNI